MQDDLLGRVTDLQVAFTALIHHKYLVGFHNLCGLLRMDEK